MTKNKNQKLELTWIGKGDDPKLEPRILIEDPAYSYGSRDTDNMLIHGDNLLALKALEQDYAGKIKCIYIDPPYNTGSAFDHYDDGIEHSTWLNLMKPRLELLKKLLCNDGSLWISIDDNECHYLKVLCDEIFGRSNFVSNVIWEKKFSPQNDAKWLSDSHDHILIYAKAKDQWRPYLLPRTEEMDERYKNPDNDPRGVWTSSDLTVKTYSEANDYEIVLPSGKSVRSTQSRCWSVSKKKFQELVDDNRIWFGADGNNMPRLKRFLSDVQEGSVSKTIWYRTEVGDNQEAKKEVKQFETDVVFATPKPERLIKKILELATVDGDIVLDSFLGSGTTAAVAHKMHRQYIGIELGDHARTHCYPRLKAVVQGEQGGISKAVGWKGGDGFKFYTLAPSLLRKDEYKQYVIDPSYNADMLAAAMAKQEGFTYSPDPDVYWKQGRSTEKDFIYTTTQFISPEQLDSIHAAMKPDESLLITCTNFKKECKNRYSNISIKKIPQMLLGRCDFDHDDYSLHIVEMPVDDTPIDYLPVEEKQEESETKKKTNDQSTLF